MKSSDDNKYDIVLVIEYFRSVSYYLSIIKYLSADFRVGLFVLPMDQVLLAKNRVAQSEFVDLCVSLGGEVILEEVVETDLLLIPQRAYTNEAKLLISSILVERKVGVLALAWAGVPEHDSFLEYFGIDIVFVVDMRFLNYLLERRGNQTVYQSRKLVEVGLPFMRYPVFEDVSVDYMIAMPTGFSFAHESDKWLCMETVLSLLAKIDPDDVVALKTHNGMDRDLFSRPRHRWLASVLGVVPGFGLAIRKIAHTMKLAYGGSFVGRVYTSYLYEKVLKRAVPFSSLTEFSQIAMEVFLPGVRKGVIGGLSNTIWGTLCAGIPYYNCVDIAIQRRDSKDRLYGKKNPANFLELNLGYFSVPYCKGRLVFDEENFNILADSTREADMISEIHRLLR